MSTGSLIDLHRAAFSDAGGLTDNISIAYGARIEDAKGGAGNDAIIVNAASNRSGAEAAATSSSSTEPDDAGAGSGARTGRRSCPTGSRISSRAPTGSICRRSTPIAGPAANDAFAYIGGAAFATQAGQLRYDAASGKS